MLIEVRHRRWLVAVVTSLVLTTACTGDSDDPEPTIVTTTSTAPPTTAPPGVDGSAAAGTYFDALASRDPAETVRMLEVTAPDSIAERYARHQVAVRGVLGATEPGQSERSPDRAVICSAPAVVEQAVVCTEFRDLTFDDEARLQSFTIDGIDLDTRVVTDGPPVTIERVTVREISAYRSPTSESTLVVLEVVNNGTSSFELFGFAATYRPTEDDPAVEAEGSWGDAVIEPGATGRVLIRFPDQPLGGIVQVSGWNDDSIGTTFPVRLSFPA